MAKLSCNVLKKRISKAESIRDQYKDLYQSGMDLTMPNRDQWSVQTQGAKKVNKLYDSIGVISLNAFVNRLQSSLTPLYTQFVKIIPGPQIKDNPNVNIEEIKLQFDKLTNMCFQYLNASNFSIAAAESYYDLGLGTGALFVENTKNPTNPLSFSSVPISHLAIDESKNGIIEGIFRTHILPARGIERTWEDAKIPKSLATTIESEPDKEIELKEATYYDVKEEKWHYTVLHNSDILVERELTRNPWVIFRWSKNNDEVFGRGPVIQAMPDLREINELKRLQIRSAQLDIYGVYTVANDGVINANTMNIQPGGMINVERNGGPNGPSIAALPRIGNFNMQTYKIEESRVAIKTLMLDNKLPPDSIGARTATEIVERMKQLQVDTGASFGRLIYEYLTPLFRNIITILIENGLFIVQKEYKELFAIDNLFSSLEIVSPIARAEAVDKINDIVQADAVMKSIDATGQLSQMTFKTEELGTLVANLQGLPQTILRTKDEKEQLNQQAALLASEQANQQQQPQQ